MGRRAVIIGGTGQIGIAAATRLIADGWEVTLAHRGTHPLAGQAATALSAMAQSDAAVDLALDRDDTAALLSATRGADLVLDTVAYTPAHAEQLALLAGEVGSLVVISTGSVYRGRNGGYLEATTSPEDFPTFPDPLVETSPTVESDAQSYSPQKAAMERRLLATNGLPVSILRPGAIHGPYSTMLREWYFIKRALDRRPFTLLAYGGDSVFSTSSTANIAELVALCTSRPGRRVLNAVDDESPTVAGIGRAVFETLGHDAEVIGLEGPPTDSGVGESPWAVPRPIRLSMELARTEVGYRAVTSYADSLEADIRWALDAVAAAESRGETWREAFPALVTRYGADAWFPDAAEDAYTAHPPF